MQVLRGLAPTTGEAAGFTMVPNLVIHGEIGGRLERLAPGIGWLVIVLLRFAERKDHVITANKATLCRLAGIQKAETLDRRMRLLTRRQKAAGLPALLRKLPGIGVHYAFRQDGVKALAGLALQTVDRHAQRSVTIRAAQSRGGTKGTQTRWGGQHNSPAGSQGKTFATPCQRSPYTEPSGSGKLSHPGSPNLSQQGRPT